MDMQTIVLASRNKKKITELQAILAADLPEVSILSLDDIGLEGEIEENVEAMTESLATVDTMQITYAARNSDFDGYDIHEGDYLALYGSQLFGTSQDIKVLLKSLAQKVSDDGKEYITIYYGADVKERHAQKAADLFAELCPDADVNLLYGGQPVYYYMISAE